MLSGHYIVGTVMGTKARTFVVQKTGANQTAYSLGISIDVVGGFSGEINTVEIRFSQDQVKSGLVDFYNKLVGKNLLIPVWHQLWATKDGVAASTIYLSGDGKPSVLPKAETA